MSTSHALIISGVLLFMLFLAGVVVLGLLKLKYGNTLAEAEVDKYVQDVSQVIANIWSNESSALNLGDDHKEVLARFQIGRTGRVSDIEIVESSGNETMDELVVTVINNAAPLKKIPPEFPERSIEIEMTFQYH
jgi:periplasmic protein TonB